MARKLFISLGFLGALLNAALSPGCGPKGQDPKASQTRTELAKNYLGGGDLASARREAQNAIRLDSNNAEAYSILGLVDYVSAVNNMKLLEIDDCLTGIDAEGLRSERDEFLRAADGAFTKATAIDGEYSEAFANQAQVAAHLEDFKRAVSLGEKALEIPHRLIDVSVTRANLGWARFELGDDVGAAKELRQALQFKPQMCLANYRMGRVYFKREEWNKALEQFQAVVSNPECPIQEAHLYAIRTRMKLSSSEDIAQSDLADAMEGCRALAPQSCVAAQCQAGI